MYLACAIFHFYFIFYFYISIIISFSFPRFDVYNIFNAYAVTYEKFIINYILYKWFTEKSKARKTAWKSHVTTHYIHIIYEWLINNVETP